MRATWSRNSSIRCEFRSVASLSSPSVQFQLVPFNLLGNLAAPAELFRDLAKLGSPAVVTLFNDAPRTTGLTTTVHAKSTRLRKSRAAMAAPVSPEAGASDRSPSASAASCPS